jgi:ABC-type uncharacterized transport system substrate-binding protein
VKTGNRQKAIAKSIKVKACGFALCATLFALCSSAEAQQTGKLYRIGYLSLAKTVADSALVESVRLALRELGYVEGQNVAIEYRYAEGRIDQFPALARELVGLKVDIIFVGGGFGPILAAKNATKTIPIVMAALSADPVEVGLVESLARPGGNVTGLTTISRELGGKRLELLKEAVPKISRVAVLYNPAGQAGVLEVKENLPTAARKLGLTIQRWEVRTVDGFEKVFSALDQTPPDGLYVTSGPLMNAYQNRIAGFALKSRLPSVYARSEAVSAGGFIYYGADLMDSYRRAVTYVDKIFKGANPAELPIERPTKFELAINLKTAKALGLKIPPQLLMEADRVIE